MSTAKIWVASAAVMALALAGCSSSTATAEDPGPAAATQQGPARVDVTEFARVLERPGVQIIDVRTPEEFAEGHIAGARNIPVQQADFAAQVAGLGRDGVYAVYCRSGNRSKPAVATMRDAGITTIYELKSGIVGWTGAGRAVTGPGAG